MGCLLCTKSCRVGPQTQRPRAGPDSGLPAGACPRRQGSEQRNGGSGWRLGAWGQSALRTSAIRVWGSAVREQEHLWDGGCSDVVSLGPGLGLGFRLGCLQDDCLKHESRATFVGVCFQTGSPLSVPLS